MVIDSQSRPDMMASCLISWRGQKLVVEIDANASLQELGEKLKELTNVTPETLRLLVPSYKILYPFSQEDSCLKLNQTPILKVKSIRMMGVLKDEVDEVLRNEKVDHRIAGFEQEDKRSRHRNIANSYASRKLPTGSYVFSDFRTLALPGVELFPPASNAMELLHMLASDPGIVAIMNKHRWRVGILTEMAPIGYVGVSPKCILGFNKNSGEEISLRLRTDDLKGFRKYQSIKKTLLHELAHMVYSEHDSNFYALDKQLNDEAATLDWTKSRGHTLSEVGHSQNYDVEFEYSNGTTSQKLGGQAPILPNARAASVDAAFQRYISTPIKQEQINDNMVEIKSHSSEMETLEESNPSNSRKSNAEVGSNITALQQQFDECGAELNLRTHGSPVTEKMDAPGQANTEVPVYLTSGQRGPASTDALTDVMQPKPEIDDPELQIIQDPVTVICNRLQSAIKKLKSEASPPQTTVVLQTLIKIIRNVAEHPEDLKFKKLRKANPAIQRNIICYKAAMDILELIGFYEDTDVTKTENFLVFKRNDPGLLWLAKSYLESSIAEETAL